MTRTTSTYAVFCRAFRLPDMKDPYPPGTYLVETEEERLETLSFVAFRRVATRLHLTRRGVLEVLPIDPKHLAEALARDEMPVEVPAAAPMRKPYDS